MIRFSEFVSLGHPDKIADYISQFILDKYIENDSSTRYAVEVQIKDNYVTLGGEIASKVRFTDDELLSYVKRAIADIGYNEEYNKIWRGNAISVNDIVLNNRIGQQSQDIAQGLNGWGDQGIFFGFATADSKTEYIPEDYALARRINKALFDSNIGGIDIKTQVLINDDDVSKVIVAIPLITESVSEVMEIVRRFAPNAEIIINGTGKYVQHSSIADCGTTGRKLVVDFYGGNSKIGGGSPWTKDGSKADLTLNLYARELAKKNAIKYGKDVYTSLACCIGKQEVDYIVTTADNKVIETGCKKIAPQELIERYNLNKPIFASMCKWGLFGEYQMDKEWERGFAQ